MFSVGQPRQCIYTNASRCLSATADLTFITCTISTSLSSRASDFVFFMTKFARAK